MTVANTYAFSNSEIRHLIFVISSMVSKVRPCMTGLSHRVRRCVNTKPAHCVPNVSAVLFPHLVESGVHGLLFSPVTGSRQV